MFLQLLVISSILLAVMLLFMGIKILVKKNGKFPNSSVEANPALRKMGITCPKAEEIRCFKGLKKGDVSACAGCSVLEKLAG